MRIKRISLQDFRGVGSVEVDFDTDGVTIVEGPNETGKTSLADAFDLLLTQKDSAAKKQIKEAKPIGRDVGPLVEAELTLGPYRVIYRKRWLRDKMTELEVIEPAPEQLSGEDAHNRMLSILEAETDQALFAALRYQQGSEISQAVIAETPSLAAALDVAAGGGEHDPAEAGKSDALLNLVDKERLRYFTPGGKVLAARVEKRDQIKGLEGEIAATEASIIDLDQAAERLNQTDREVVELEERFPDLEERITAGAKDVEAVEALEHKVGVAQQALELAEAALGDAETKQEARATLVAAADRATGALQKAVDGIALQESDLAGTTERAGEVRQFYEAAVEAVRVAEGAAKSDREHLAVLELAFRRDELRERRERFETAELEAADAERFLAESTVDERLVGEIDEASIAVAVADGRVEAGQGRLRVEALKAMSLRLGSDSRTVEAGDVVEAGVAVETTAVINDIARVTVVPPREGAEVESEASRAHDRLRTLLESAGVESASAAHDALRERLRREGDRKNGRQRRSEALKDLEPAELLAKLERAQQRLAEHEHGGARVAPTPAAFDEARERLHQVEGRLEELGEAAEAAQLSSLEIEEALRVVEDRSIERRTRREAAEEEVERAGAELDTARTKVGDQELDYAVTEGVTRLSAARLTLDGLEEELQAGDPESVRATFENDKDLKERLNKDLGDRRVSAARVGERLRLGGLEGLSGRRDEFRAKLSGLERELASENRLAAAAAHLHALLAEKREQAQRAYAGPFVEKVNAYARVLFGPEVKVAVDHRDFSLASRTLGGTTVPFDSLSGGAREQLAVLARLACAALVSPGGGADAQRGVPVIIDDALGYSDPSRLGKLGAAFGMAGKDCQVIVLTCEPGRYRGIGGATVVSMDREMEASSEVAEIPV
jgi:hypothetical protein